jgi:hypothetical protein
MIGLGIGLSLALGTQGPMGGGSPAPWILAAGAWNDSGVWKDSATWNDS